MLNGLFDVGGGGVLAVFAIVVIVVLLVLYASRRYQVAGPNEALIIAGAQGAKIRQPSGEVAALTDSGNRVVVGAGALVIPIKHRAFRLSLQTYPSAINLDDGVTAQGIRVRVNATAVFKIGRQPTQIRAAAERFLGQEDQIEPTVQQVLIGSLRSIVGKLTIDALVKERQTLIDLVFLEAKKELEPLGIDLDILNIQDITDEGFAGQESYIAQLGKQSYQTVRQNAEVATAQAEQKIIEARRAQQLTAADAKAQTDAAERRAAQAGPLADAEAAQAVTRRQTELAELEAVRREKELLATQIKTAQAEATAAVARAQGAKSATIAAAQGEAERVRIEGQAAADAIYARGEAEAEALSLRAEAYRQFNEAAIVSAILERLPDIVRAAAEPISGDRVADDPLDRRRVGGRPDRHEHRRPGERGRPVADRDRPAFGGRLGDDQRRRGVDGRRGCDWPPTSARAGRPAPRRRPRSRPMRRRQPRPRPRRPPTPKRPRWLRTRRPGPRRRHAPTRRMRRPPPRSPMSRLPPPASPRASRRPRPPRRPPTAPAPPAATTQASAATEPTRSSAARSTAALDAAVTRLGFDDELQRMARLASGIPGIERLGNRKVADFAESHDAPTIVRQLFTSLPGGAPGPDRVADPRRLHAEVRGADWLTAVMGPFWLTGIVLFGATMALGLLTSSVRPLGTPEAAAPARSLFVIHAAYIEGIGILGVVVGLLAITNGLPAAPIVVAGPAVVGAGVGLGIVLARRRSLEPTTTTIGAMFIVGLAVLGIVVAILGRTLAVQRTVEVLDWPFIVGGLVAAAAALEIGRSGGIAVGNTIGADADAAALIRERQIRRCFWAELAALVALGGAITTLLLG